MKCRHRGLSYGWRGVFGQRPPKRGAKCFCGTLIECLYCHEQHLVVELCLVCAWKRDPRRSA